MENSEASFNLVLAVHHRSQDSPQSLAIFSEERAVTYGQLGHCASGLADRLQRSPGWASHPGMQPRVGILASRSAEACIALLGACWAGATYVPLGVKLPEERLLALLSLCKLSAIVTDEQGARLLSDRVLQDAPATIYALGPGPPDHVGNSRAIWLDRESLAASELVQPVHVNAADLAYIIFTSGSTGMPKGVMIPACAVRHFIESLTALAGLRATDRVLDTAELTFDASVQNMFCTWEAGAALYLLPATRVMNAVRFAHKNALTVWTSVPSLVGLLRQVKALSPNALPTLRLALFGGEPLSIGTVDAWRRAAPACAIYNVYGPTEVTVDCLSQLVTDPILLTPGRDVIPIGTALPGCEAAVLDAAGNPVQDNCSGELAIAGAQLATGYLDAPDLTAARFPILQGKRWYLTGDLAMRDMTGTFHCLGRIDNQIKVLGHRVELEEIDAHLRIAAQADMVATVAWPISDGSAQGLVAFVAAQSIDDVDIIDRLKTRLPHYMIPSRIIALENMPVNASGKVDRKAVQHLLQQGVR